MDRKQAIKIIKDCKEKSFKRTLYTLNEYHEAVDMAITALEQEPCDHYTEGYFKGYDDGQKGKLEQEPCEDAINRSDAIRVASGYCHWSNIPKELAKLPSVNPKPCEDAISRQAAIDAIESKQKKIMRSDWAIDQAKFSAMSEIRALIADLPSVSTENTGRWEDVQFRTIPYNRISKAKKCSVCGKRKDNYVTWNYCPNCGAKMRP